MIGKTIYPLRDKDLNNRYEFIKKMLNKLSKNNFLHKRLITLAQMYVDIDKGYRFSYMPYENGEIEFLDAILKMKNSIIFFDVGSHLGTYTQMVLDRFKSYEGHLFEISEITFKKCQKLYGSDLRLAINNSALSDEIGEVEYRHFHDDPTRDGISGVGIDPGFDFELLKSPSLTGDHYCEEFGINHIDLLKIDAEGYDLNVLKGFGRMLSNGEIDIIQFEYNIRHGDLHILIKDFFEFLENHNYVLGPLRQEGVDFKEFTSRDNNFESGPNYVACLPKFQPLLASFKPSQRSIIK